MLRFFKAQASSLIASATDFLITALAVSFLGWWFVTGSIIGTVSGGFVNFYINRNWVFKATLKKVYPQVIRYVLVWSGNLLLVTVLVYLLTHFFNLNYLGSKIAVSTVMGLSYNYYMQKQFIFLAK
ncbi:GtrA family protein [Pedobacter sp. MC2016-05]|uniref:GtrA family protein n=1 Tax=Pedobacter sp. MC2016-05 TaxID=2994474 RepID=UPI002246BAA8|nr:GtrA family protein [Pedobacter sp. MC2016-05]MCX2475333.1 GtrA family protein [Pedobacter sp. MC2016-05]